MCGIIHIEYHHAGGLPRSHLVLTAKPESGSANSQYLSCAYVHCSGYLLLFNKLPPKLGSLKQPFIWVLVLWLKNLGMPLLGHLSRIYMAFLGHLRLGGPQSHVWHLSAHWPQFPHGLACHSLVVLG